LPRLAPGPALVLARGLAALGPSAKGSLTALAQRLKGVGDWQSFVTRDDGITALVGAVQAIGPSGDAAVDGAVRDGLAAAVAATRDGAFPEAARAASDALSAWPQH
jgi:hypothetical protein